MTIFITNMYDLNVHSEGKIGNFYGLEKAPHPLWGFWSSGNSPSSPHPGVPNIDVKEIMNLYVIVRRGEEVGLAP